MVVKKLRPQNYIDAFYIGHYYCEGNTVVMDLTGMAGADARPFVDFAAGLVIGQDGAMERIGPRLFLLVPPGKLGAKATGAPWGSPPGSAQPTTLPDPSPA